MGPVELSSNDEVETYYEGNPMTRKSLLSVKDLRVQLGETRAVSGVSFNVKPGEFYGIVGESGSGKSVTARSIIGLLPKYAQVEGEIYFQEKQLIGQPLPVLQQVRGSRIGFVFQDALAALDPVYTIGDQLIEIALNNIEGETKKSAAKSAIDLLHEVGIGRPEVCMKSYPHQLSGGMQQRVVIAAALIGNPDLIIADEPTTALDVTIQRQVLLLLRKISERWGTAVILITHDLAVIAETCDRVGVFYGGVMVEESTTVDLFEQPQHPYTQALLKTLPRVGATGPFVAIPGNPIRVSQELTGCPFAARCPYVIDACSEGVPEERRVKTSRVRCIRAEEIEYESDH